jgi:hypothetical protein
VLAGRGHDVEVLSTLRRRAAPEPVVLRVPVRRDGARFTASLRAGPLVAGWAGEPQTWDLWLSDGTLAAPVRLGRFLDEVVSKNLAYVFPDVAVGEVRAQPFYTRQNEFSVRVIGPTA